MAGAIIFDFDGVIVDTEPLHYRAFAETLVPRSIDLTREEYFQLYLGLNDAEIIRRFLRDRGLTWNEAVTAEFRREKNAKYQEIVAGGLELLSGVRKLIEEATDNGLPIAICSGARRKEIVNVLERHNLKEAFRGVVSADDVPTSKPDPTGYLRALEILRTDYSDLGSRDCLVIEDSVVGIRAAKAARMKVLGVLGGPGHLTDEQRNLRIAEADWICESLMEIDCGAIARLMGQRG